MRIAFPSKIAVLGFGCLAALNCVFAASYPSKPVRIITASLPGSATDVPARLVASRLTELWGQQFIVDNRGGAGGQIATELAAKATPDGYTLFFSSDGPITIIPALKRNLPYDPLKDFEPLAFGDFNNYILMVNPKLPVHTVSDLVALARSKPGVDVRTWGAFFAPAGTPKAILDKLHDEITRQLNSPETKKLLASQGLSVEAMTRSELRDLVKADIKKYTELVRAIKMPLTD